MYPEDIDSQIHYRPLAVEMEADAYMLGSLVIIGIVVFLAWKFANFLLRRKPPTAPFVVSGQQGDPFYSSSNERHHREVATNLSQANGMSNGKNTLSKNENIEMRTMNFQATSDGATSPSLSPVGPSSGKTTVSQQGQFVTGTTNEGLRKRSAGYAERSFRAQDARSGAVRERSIKQSMQQRSKSEGRLTQATKYDRLSYN